MERQISSFWLNMKAYHCGVRRAETAELQTKNFSILTFKIIAGYKLNAFLRPFISSQFGANGINRRYTNSDDLETFSKKYFYNLYLNENLTRF